MMGKFLVIILFLIICGILFAFPLWAVVNIVCWAFHLSFHLSLFQAFSICLLVSVIKKLFFNEEDE